VLLLKDIITYGTYIQPACLPKSTTNVLNTRGTIVGYGLTENTTTRENRPKFVEIPSIDKEYCLWNSHTFQVFGSNRTFCAGEWGKNPCRGDSGGGFFVKSSNVFTVTGIVSAGSFDCDSIQFAVFTNVPNFIDWIREDMVKEDEEQVNVTLVCSFETSRVNQ
jgi:secreted trypsin-like serine protease